MKRMKKIGGSILLAATLVIAGIGTTPARQQTLAAETPVTLEQFNTELTAIGNKIAELAKTATLKTSVSGSATIMGSSIPLSFDMDVDGTSKTGHGRMPLIQPTDSSAMTGLFTGTSSLPYEDMFMDLTKNLMYIHDENSGIDLIRDFAGASYLNGFGLGESGGNMFTSMFTPELLDLMKDHMTLSADLTTLADEACQKITMKLKYGKGELVSLIEASLKQLPDMFKSYAGMFDPKLFADMTLDADISFILSVDHAPKQISINATIDGLSFGGFPLGTIKTDLKTAFSSIADSIVIPADRIEKAIPAPSCVAVTSGLKLTTGINNKGKAFFSVSDVSKKGAKKLTIPAQATIFGKTLNVTAVEKQAFKNAGKLKTLVVKNAKLKKTLKKNPSKYGLKKSVKIK